MKLIERMFLITLIKNNYRRRMLWFYFNLVLLIVGGLGTYYFKTLSAYIFLPSAMIFMIEILVFSFYYSSFDNFPWMIKHKEIKALNKARNLDFKYLSTHPLLNKYFN